MQITDEKGVQYYQGRYVKNKITQYGHLLITLDDPFILYPNLGRPMRVQSRINPMNFIVPKRRSRVMDLAQRIPIGAQLTIKLMQEPRSKKYTVSLIHFEVEPCN